MLLRLAAMTTCFLALVFLPLRVIDNMQASTRGIGNSRRGEFGRNPRGERRSATGARCRRPCATGLLSGTKEAIRRPCRRTEAPSCASSSPTPPKTCASKRTSTRRPARARSACAFASAASADRTCTITITAASERCGFGEPMILGHEIAGVVEARGRRGCERVRIGDRVAVNPSVPCNRCRYCLEGRQNHCLDMRFYGSAMRFPHVQGAFRETLVCRESQAHVVRRRRHSGRGRDGGTAGRLPAWRAPRRVAASASAFWSRGSGPIGALAAIAARRAGAAEIVVTDIADGALGFRRAQSGADRTLNVAARPARAGAYSADKG